MSLPPELLTVYQRQKYQIVGRHSAVKTCHWTREALRTGEERFCYKQRFYGVRSLQCLQMTPSLGRCLQACLFCWRAMSTDLGIDWDQTSFPRETADDAAKIVEESVLAQRRALAGFKGDERIDRELFSQAMRPKHAAISLEGEVTMYPWIDLLVEEYFSHDFKTIILVTNGLNPDALRRMRREPSQLYISLSAPNRETYSKVCRPLVRDGWKRLQETLSLLKEFSCPTVLRLTLAKGLNITDPEAYADIILKTEPTYVEPKAAMAVGFFLERLPRDAMPTHSDIQNFATQLSDLTGYRILDEFNPSSVVLLSRLRNPKKLV